MIEAVKFSLLVVGLVLGLGWGLPVLIALFARGCTPRHRRPAPTTLYAPVELDRRDRSRAGRRAADDTSGDERG